MHPYRRVLYILLPTWKLRIKGNLGGPGWDSMEDEGVVGQKEDQLGSTPEENCINQEGLRREKKTGERGDPKADRLQSGVVGSLGEFAHQLGQLPFTVTETPTRQNQLQSDYQCSLPPAAPIYLPRAMRLGPVLVHPTWQAM